MSERTEHLVRVGFHGDAEDVVVRVLALDGEGAADVAFDWFGQDHDGPAVLEVEALDPADVPADVAEAAELINPNHR